MLSITGTKNTFIVRSSNARVKRFDILPTDFMTVFKSFWRIVTYKT